MVWSTSTRMESRTWEELWPGLTIQYTMNFPSRKHCPRPTSGSRKCWHTYSMRKWRIRLRSMGLQQSTSWLTTWIASAFTKSVLTYLEPFSRSQWLLPRPLRACSPYRQSLCPCYLGYPLGAGNHRQYHPICVRNSSHYRVASFSHPLLLVVFVSLLPQLCAMPLLISCALFTFRVPSIFSVAPHIPFHSHRQHLDSQQPAQ